MYRYSDYHAVQHAGWEYVIAALLVVFLAVLIIGMILAFANDLIWPILRRLWCNCDDCRKWRGDYPPPPPAPVAPPVVSRQQILPPLVVTQIPFREPRNDEPPEEFMSPPRDWPFR